MGEGRKGEIRNYCVLLGPEKGQKGREEMVDDKLRPLG